MCGASQEAYVWRPDPLVTWDEYVPTKYPMISFVPEVGHGNYDAFLNEVASNGFVVIGVMAAEGRCYKAAVD